MFGGCSSGGPSIGARLARLGRVDSPKPIGHAIDLERIAINHTGRLSEGGRGSEREGSSQGGQFHRSWLARDWGNNAATVSRPATINRGGNSGFAAEPIDDRGVASILPPGAVALGASSMPGARPPTR